MRNNCTLHSFSIQCWSLLREDRSPILEPRLPVTEIQLFFAPFLYLLGQLRFLVENWILAKCSTFYPLVWFSWMNIFEYYQFSLLSIPKWRCSFWISSCSLDSEKMKTLSKGWWHETGGDFLKVSVSMAGEMTRWERALPLNLMASLIPAAHVAGVKKWLPVVLLPPKLYSMACTSPHTNYPHLQ